MPRISPRNAEQSFALNVLMNDKIQLVILTRQEREKIVNFGLSPEKRKTYQQIFLANLIP